MPDQATDHPYIKHKSAKMTLDTYADLFDDDLDAVAVTLHARYVSKMCPRDLTQGKQ